MDYNYIDRIDEKRFEKNLKKTLGQAITIHRIRQNMSKVELAEKAKISRKYLTLVEQGKVNLTLVKIWQIARALNMKPWYLIKYDGETKILTKAPQE